MLNSVNKLKKREHRKCPEGLVDEKICGGYSKSCLSGVLR